MMKEFVTAQELAVVLRVCLRTVWRWHAEGKLPPPFRVGRVIRWRTRDVFAFLDEEPSAITPRKPA